MGIASHTVHHPSMGYPFGNASELLSLDNNSVSMTNLNTKRKYSHYTHIIIHKSNRLHYMKHFIHHKNFYNVPFITNILNFDILITSLLLRAVESVPFFGSGSSNFVGATAGAGANLVKQVPEPKTGSNA